MTKRHSEFTLWRTQRLCVCRLEWAAAVSASAEVHQLWQPSCWAGGQKRSSGSGSTDYFLRFVKFVWCATRYFANTETWAKTLSSAFAFWQRVVKSTVLGADVWSCTSPGAEPQTNPDGEPSAAASVPHPGTFTFYFFIFPQSTSSALCSRNRRSSSFDQLTSNSHVDFGHSQSEPLVPPGRPPPPAGALSAASACCSSEHEESRGAHISPPHLHLAHTLDRSHHLWMTLFINKIRSALFLTAAPAFVTVKLHLKWCHVSPAASFGDRRVGSGIDSSMIGMCLDGYTLEKVELMEHRVSCPTLKLDVVLFRLAAADWSFSSFTSETQPPVFLYVLLKNLQASKEDWELCRSGRTGCDAFKEMCSERVNWAFRAWSLNRRDFTVQQWSLWSLNVETGQNKHKYSRWIDVKSCDYCIFRTMSK